MTRSFRYRDEPPLRDSDVVVRGGAMSEAAVVASIERCIKIYGVAGISVAAISGEEASEVVDASPVLANYNRLQVSTAGELRAAKFSLIATGDRPHYTLLLPAVDPTECWECLAELFRDL